MAQRWKIVATLAALAVATWAALAPGPAWAWDPAAPAPPADFTAFHRRFSSDLYAYPRHGAAPPGLRRADRHRHPRRRLRRPALEPPPPQDRRRGGEGRGRPGRGADRLRALRTLRRDDDDRTDRPALRHRHPPRRGDAPRHG